MSQSQGSSGQRKALNFRPRIFAAELFMFFVVQGLGLYVGYTLTTQGYAAYGETSTSIVSFLIAFAIATALIVLLLKFFKGGMFFQALMAFLIFIGAETVFSTYLPYMLALLIAVGLVALRFLMPNVLVQNLTIMIAIAGIGASIGLMIPVPAIIVLLAVLSIYDIIAVYKTKHMVTLFKGMVERGVPLSLVVPDKAHKLKSKIKHAKPGTGEFLMLGTGDIAFPVIFAVSALQYGLLSSICVIIGAFVGLAVVHVILTLKGKGAVPALPPIAVFSILGFVVSLLL
jgi:presenilin-like A22 family membrane protease